MHTRVQFKMMTLRPKVSSSLESQASLAPAPAGKEGGGPGCREGSGREKRSLEGGQKRRNGLCSVGYSFPA